MLMSAGPQNTGRIGLGVPAKSSGTAGKTQIEIFLPSSYSPHPEVQDSDCVPNNAGTETTDSEGQDQISLSRKWESPTMAHPLYQPMNRTDADPPKLKPRFAKFSRPGTGTSVPPTNCSSEEGVKSAELLGEINGLPGPGISKNAKFLASYSHNYGHSEGGKTWWSAK